MRVTSKLHLFISYECIFVQTIFSHRYATQLSLLGYSVSDANVKDQLSALRHWDWQSAYRNFELLQQLPFDRINSCACEGICCDGTMQCIRLKQLHIKPLDVESEPRKSVPFRTHTLIASKQIRDKVSQYIHQFVSFLQMSYLIIFMIFLDRLASQGLASLTEFEHLISDLKTEIYGFVLIELFRLVPPQFSTKTNQVPAVCFLVMYVENFATARFQIYYSSDRLVGSMNHHLRLIIVCT